MQALDPAGVYTDAAVIDALTGELGTRTLTFRYSRLDNNNTFIETLDYVAHGSVANNSFADIKRTARFTIRDLTAVNFLRDRIQPWACLKMPDGGFVKWPLGVFLLATPARSLGDAGTVMRDVEAYDQLLVLMDDKVENRYTIAAGVAYTTAIAALVASAGIVTPAPAIVPSALTLPVAMEWEPGTAKLRILNDLLDAINYGSAWFNERGQLICRPYLSPADRATEYLYSDTSASVRTGSAEQTIDLFSVPNKFVLVKSEPDQAPLTAVVTNTNPASPTSTVSRGRTIVSFVDEEDAADLTTLNAKAARYAFEASQVFEEVTFDTALMPMHSEADILALNIPGLAINAKYSETSWEMPLAVGATMKHTVRRVVTV